MHDSPPLEEIFTLALATASALLTEKTGAQLTLSSFCVRPLADFSGASEADHADVVAGVAQRFSGVLRGTSVFTMQPEGALLWSRSAAEPDSDPDRVLSTFVDLGSRVLEDVVGTAAHAMHGQSMGQSIGQSVEFDAATLRENSRVAIVLATHAPSDTAIATLGFDVGFHGAAHAAHVDLLLEPKLLPGHWAGPDSE